MRGTTRLLTTGTGVRPLGVRGDPLHHAEEQIRAVIRRRLGDRHYHVLAEPEPHERSGRIDWYSDLDGPVEPLTGLRPDVRDRVRADIDALLDDIDRLGRSLQASASEDSRYAGELLRLAARRPTDDYLFLVGGQPVVACWGYDVLATRAALPAIFEPPAAVPPAMPPPPPVPSPPASAPPAPLPLAATPPAGPPPPVAATPAAASASLTGRRWLLAALLPLLLLASGFWFMTRQGDTVTCVATQRRQTVVLVLDTSNSMALPADLAREEADAVEDGVEQGDPRALQRFQRLIRQSGRKRFDDAREAAIRLMKAVPDAAEVGLVSFVRTCDARVDVRPAQGARGDVIRELQAAAPRSGTPLAAAMKLAADELAASSSSDDAGRTMVILTDGRESCRGDPCAEARALKSRLPKAVVHVVDVTGRSGLQCVADVTGGTMVTARTADQLRAAIRQVQTTICR